MTYKSDNKRARLYCTEHIANCQFVCLRGHAESYSEQLGYNAHALTPSPP